MEFMEAKQVDTYWSSFFGLTPPDMEDSGVRVLTCSPKVHPF